VFGFLAHSPLGFWIVAFLIVLFDSTLLLVPEKFTFTFRNRLNVRMRIVENPYLLRHKEPVVTLFAHPIEPFFISSMDVPSQDRRSTKQVLVQQKRAASNSKQLAHLAFLSLVLVCIVGPVASLQYGIERGLLMVAPALYASALCGAGIVWLNRSTLSLGTRDVAKICIELIVCPVLIINVFKRIAVRQPNPCTNDLINYFSEDQAEAFKRLEQHIGATAK
jgi:hypothetical protein